MESIGSPLLWAGFMVFVLGMLALDLGVFHRKAHEVSVKEAAIWSAVWIACAGVFNVGVWHWFGPEMGLQFAAGYVLEKALSVDNVFVFVLIFTAFRVPGHLQHRVLFWGVLGALVLRAIFIVAGAALLSAFHWVMYVFGAILLLTAGKMMWEKEDDGMDAEGNVVMRLFRRLVPTTDGWRESHFLVKEGGRWMATPLMAVLVLVETSDVIFAVDSIPAIFAVSRDPFIVFTSNVFAILGLRSLYFLLAGVVHRFHYLKPALALVLAFVGVKMLLTDVYKVPIGLSLGVIAGLIGGAVALSWLRPAPEAQEPGTAPEP